jgi:hypothetical protein
MSAHSGGVGRFPASIILDGAERPSAVGDGLISHASDALARIDSMDI